MRNAIVVSQNNNQIYLEEFCVKNDNYERLFPINNSTMINTYLSKIFKNSVYDVKYMDHDLLLGVGNKLVVVENYLKIKDHPSLKIVNKNVSMYYLMNNLKNKKIILKKENKYIKRRVAALLAVPIMGFAAISISEIENVDIFAETKKVENEQINLIKNENMQDEIMLLNEQIETDNYENQTLSNNVSFLYQYDKSYSEEELTEMVHRFSKMNLYEYDEAIEILKKELPSTVNEYPNIEVAIMRTLTIKGYEDNRLEGKIIENNLSYEEIELLALDYLRMYEKDDIYHKQLVLAVLRLESGWGKDNNPITLNNYGNIRNFDTGEYVKYKTSELGVESAVRNILNIEEKAINELNNPNQNEILYKTASIYAEDNVNWYKRVSEIMHDVEEDYNFINETKTNIY